MAKDEWTTGEVENWLLNDEGLYQWAMNTAKWHGKRYALLRTLMREGCTQFARDGRLGDLNVTAMRRVDWDVVTQTILESAKEEANV